MRSFNSYDVYRIFCIIADIIILILIGILIKKIQEDDKNNCKQSIKKIDTKKRLEKEIKRYKKERGN